MRTETLGLPPAEGPSICMDAYSLTRSPTKEGLTMNPGANTLLGPVPTVGTACKSTDAASLIPL